MVSAGGLLTMTPWRALMHAGANDNVRHAVAKQANDIAKDHPE